MGRVLSDHFDEVVVLERRPRPADGESIAAHGRMLHALLIPFSDGLESMFPGIRGELRSHGAIDVVGPNGSWWSEGYRVVADAVPVQSATRGLVESLVRTRVEQTVNVDVRYETAVRDLVVTGRAVTGGRTTEADVPADLVVDCSGRTSKSARWLASAGLATPTTDEVGVDLWYGQAVIARDESATPGLDYLVVQGDSAARPRSGSAVHVEGDRWIVILSGYFGDRPPKDPDGFIAYAQSLPTPDIADLLRTAPSLGDITHHAFKSSRRSRYERTPPPPGLLPAGDAVSSFNPLYGQGMAVAVQEAQVLHTLLAERGNAPDLPARATRRFARIIDNPWQIAAGADLRLPATTGRRTPLTRLGNAYAKQVLRATTVDERVAYAMFEVQNLLRPPASLARPDILMRTMRAQHRWRKGSRSAHDARHRPVTHAAKV